MSSIKEAAHEFCKALFILDRWDEETIPYIRALVGCPASSAETVELIELLQTEQSLLHERASQNPGHPTKEQIAYFGRLQSTKELLGSMYKSSVQAGFPTKGFGYRTNFAAVAQFEIDRLALEIATARAENSAGLPLGLPNPPGLPEPLGAVSLSSIRAPAQALRKSAASTTAQATPIKVFIGTPRSDTADQASVLSPAILAPPAGRLATLAQQGEQLSLKQKVLEAKLKSIKGAGVKSLLSSTKSSTTSDSSSSQSKSVSHESKTGSTSSSTSSAKTPDQIELKLRAARFKADIAQLKLDQINADREIALLLTEAETAKVNFAKASSEASMKTASSSHPGSPNKVTTTALRSTAPPIPSSSSEHGSDAALPAPSESPSSSRHKTPPPTARRYPKSPSPDEAQAIMLQAQLDEVNSRIAANRVLADSQG